MQYSKELKASILSRILPPGNEPIAKVAKEAGLSEQTIRNWKAAALKDGIDSIDGESSANKWTSQDKFQIVVETIGMNEIELAEYAREKGIFVDDIKVWRDACISANGGVAREAALYKKELKASEKENKRLSKELERKNAALAETAALLVLRKKANAIWGGSRGRMISASDRSKAIELIDEAVESGARLFRACEELGINKRTYRRWVSKLKGTGTAADSRPISVHPEPANKLTKEERKKILETVNSEEYKDMPPCEIVPSLADKGEYIGSESTIYRILREEKQLAHRGRTEAPHKRVITTHEATDKNQVWMWDITYLNGPVRGQFYYLYMFSDLYTRDIVGWEVYDTEDAEHASDTIRRLCFKHHIKSTDLLILHSDNGSPMKGATMLETLYKLGITPSNSRPRVSNDNAYAESLFKTLKYRPNYQPKGFETLQEAREWVSGFVHWYRYDHHHSGICYLTPAQLFEGNGWDILDKRHKLYEEAKRQHPERWNGRSTRNWSLPDVVYLNPEKPATEHNIQELSKEEQSNIRAMIEENIA